MSPEVDGDLVSTAVVDETVDALCELRREDAIAYSIDVGRVIVERMYGGDLDRLRARRDKSRLSLRALAGHPRMPLSATALHHAVGVYVLVSRVPGLLDTDLTLTHLRAVLSLSEEAQDQMLSRAVAEGWTRKRLMQAVRGERTGRSRAGRPRLPRVVKTLHRLDRLAEEGDAWGDLDDIGELPSDKRRASSENVALLERRLRGVKLRLSALDEVQPASNWRAVGDHIRWRRSIERRPADDERLRAQTERSADE